jgi:hypothetical protein
MIHNAWEFKELFICPPTISLIKKFVTAEGSMILSTRELKVLCIWPPTNNFSLIKNLWRQKAPQFRIYRSLKCYTWPSINNFIVIKNMWHRKARQLPPTSLGWVQEFLPRLHIQLASIVQARSSHAIIYDVHIFIIIGKIITRHYLCCSHIHHNTSSTDEARWIFGQVFMRPSYYSTDTSFIMMGSNILSGQWGEGNTIVWVDEDRRTHDWALTRRKSSSSSTHSVYIRCDDGVVMTGFW